MVDTGRHDLDALRDRAVERRELIALGVGGREHEIGTRDHRVLDARALVGIVVDAGVGLHARERVERRDHREVAAGA